MRRYAERETGFTLIELLVVIAVIAIIAGILFPVFAQAREKARQAACLSNMKQIGTAHMLYLQDYDEAFVPTFVWTGLEQQPDSPDPFQRRADQRLWTQLLQPYLKDYRVFYCPSFNEAVLKVNLEHSSCWGGPVPGLFPARFYFSHYGMGWGQAWGECTAQRPRVAAAGNTPFIPEWKTLGMVARPAETALFQDNFVAEVAGGIAGGFGCECGIKGTREKDGVGRSRHHQGCNYIFVDGHAGLMNLDPEREPTISCHGAAIDGVSYPDCVCAKYVTYDY